MSKVGQRDFAVCAYCSETATVRWACKACRASIVMLQTRSGKWMPVDKETYNHGDVTFDAKQHRSHFATCPKADKFRRKETPTSAQG